MITLDLSTFECRVKQLEAKMAELEVKRWRSGSFVAILISAVLGVPAVFAELERLLGEAGAKSLFAKAQQYYADIEIELAD